MALRDQTRKVNLRYTYMYAPIINTANPTKGIATLLRQARDASAHAFVA